jgi:hypothetical protein
MGSSARPPRLGYRRMCFRRGRQYSEDADLLVGVFPSFSFGALTPCMALIDSIVWLVTRGIREFDPPGDHSDSIVRVLCPRVAVRRTHMVSRIPRGITAIPSSGCSAHALQFGARTWWAPLNQTAIELSSSSIPRSQIALQLRPSTAAPPTSGFRPPTPACLRHLASHLRHFLLPKLARLAVRSPAVARPPRKSDLA